ncbi:MAG: DUF1080 domain-containing protein [Acidobacteria bacterium]|nr:DUF1080 domain-containing protein [Acidobacteriota bacterium]
MRLLICLAAAAAAAQDLKPLFDGKTLKGWHQCNGKATYSVEKGEIVGRTVEGSPNSFLCTDREYGDFVLELETKTDPVLNSGIQIRSHKYATDQEVITENKGSRRVRHPAGRIHGYQVEIANEASGSSGGIYDEARRGWVANIATDPAASKAFKDNQWNKYRIEARGDRIRTWVNGVPAADLTDSMDLTGYIALQVHSFKGPHPAEVRWRNVRLADLGKHQWRRIFDGSTLKGWKVDGGGEWKATDGALYGKQPGGTGPRGLLISEAEYADFTLRLKYKITQGNSGVFFRMASPPSAKEMGFEVEVDPARDAGGLQAPGTRGWLQHTGPVEQTPFYRAGDWNEMTVSAHGRRIVVHVNGKQASQSLDDPGRLTGHLALQLNPRTALEVWYKDIDILEKAR